MLCSTAELAARWIQPGRSLFPPELGPGAPCDPLAQAVPPNKAQKAGTGSLGAAGN